MSFSEEAIIFKPSQPRYYADLLKWQDDLNICAYGEVIQPRSKQFLTEFSHFFTALSGLKVTIEWQKNAADCQKALPIYFRFYRGQFELAVMRQEVARHLQLGHSNSIELIRLESKMAQTGVIEQNTGEITVFTFINQPPDIEDKTLTLFYRNTLLEELMHTFSFGNDITTEGTPHSVLEEKCEIMSLFPEGNYRKASGQAYNANRPEGLTQFDVMLLILMYRYLPETTYERDVPALIRRHFDEIQTDAKQLMKTYRQHCAWSNPICGGAMN